MEYTNSLYTSEETIYVIIPAKKLTWLPKKDFALENLTPALKQVAIVGIYSWNFWVFSSSKPKNPPDLSILKEANKICFCSFLKRQHGLSF